ncbi:hypothetical protein GL213_11380 [Halogeometricum borinquense]|uniref:Uncharacterized protein n=1 Tax=Halogeometricum borinquense TaxID=60847 RepID=A0A6C0UH30_9EURY|nr:hypothetical protein [Halogeometricum borinquense]QIB73571.1 hypothetical protein G3I44_04310 [Halogeometricum borinquense]QIQ77074.1 hypothetical protein GL213_11380 [Halogeometricum borinquense]
MSGDVRQIAVGAFLLLASSVLFLTTGVDGRISALLAVTAAGAAAIVIVRLLSAPDGQAA